MQYDCDLFAVIKLQTHYISFLALCKYFKFLIRAGSRNPTRTDSGV